MNIRQKTLLARTRFVRRCISAQQHLFAKAINRDIIALSKDLLRGTGSDTLDFGELYHVGLLNDTVCITAYDRQGPCGCDRPTAIRLVRSRDNGPVTGFCVNVELDWNDVETGGDYLSFFESAGLLEQLIKVRQCLEEEGFHVNRDGIVTAEEDEENEPERRPDRKESPVFGFAIEPPHGLPGNRESELWEELNNVGIYDFTLFETEAEAVSFLRKHNIGGRPFECNEYREGDIEDPTFIDSDGAMLYRYENGKKIYE